MPETREYAKLSMVAYGSEEPGGWIVARRPDANLTKSGFYALVYRNVANNEIVIAFRGTEPIDGFFDDLLGADGAIYTGREHQQFIDALEFAVAIRDAYQGQGYTISVTGHSLGGGLAQLVADVFGWNGVTFEAPGMAKYQNYPADGLFAKFFADHPDLGFGNAANLANYTVFGSAISSETGSHIGAKHELVTPEGRPNLAALVVESEVLPAEALLLFAPISTLYDQFSVRHSMASLHRYVEGLSNAGLLLQTYISAFTAYGVTGYDPTDQNLLETLTEVFNDVLNPEKELSQAQTEQLVQDLSTLKDSAAFADASERDITDLQKAQDLLRIATQDIAAVTIDNDHWTEQPGAGNRLTVRIELEHTLAQTPQWLRIELPHTDHLTGEPLGYVIDTPGVQAVTTDQGSMAPPLIGHFLLPVDADNNVAELTLRALPDEDHQDN